MKSQRSKRCPASPQSQLAIILMIRFMDPWLRDHSNRFMKHAPLPHDPGVLPRQQAIVLEGRVAPYHLLLAVRVDLVDAKKGGEKG